MTKSGRPRFTVTLRRPAEQALIRCRSCGYEGRVLHAHLRYHWYFLPAAIVLGCTIIGVVALVALVVYLGQLTWPTCPRCGAISRLGSWNGLPTPDANDVWRQAAEDDRRQFLKTKLALVSLTGLAIGMVLIYALIQIWF